MKYLLRFFWYLFPWLMPCEHDWRPAITSLGPARYCDICTVTEQITEAEFYAQFGRMPII